MKRWFKFGVAAVALVAVAVVALVVIQLLRSDNPNLATEAPAINTPVPGAGPTASALASGASGTTGTTGSDAGSSSPSLPAGVHQFVIDPSQSSAKYVVQETLRGLDSTAVGTTSAISGSISSRTAVSTRTCLPSSRSTFRR